MAYAENTSVPVEKSRAEIEQLLSRYGADQFASGWDNERRIATIQFRAGGRIIRFILPIPKANERRFTHAKHKNRYYEVQRSKGAALTAWQHEMRRCWRSLALVIKAKLEAVETGITSFEAEFLAHIVLPDGTTVGQWAGPQLEHVYATGQMPKSILALPAPEETPES